MLAWHHNACALYHFRALPPYSLPFTGHTVKRRSPRASITQWHIANPHYNLQPWRRDRALSWWHASRGPHAHFLYLAGMARQGEEESQRWREIMGAS
jgi:hypothetical protein